MENNIYSKNKKRVLGKIKRNKRKGKKKRKE